MITSAAGILALLHESKDELKNFALSKLHELQATFWAEIAGEITTIEELSENQSFSGRGSSALLASKIHYHLGAYEDSLNFALDAGEFFDVNERSEYVATTIAKCIDKYTSIRVEQQNSSSLAAMDSRLEAIVNRMFQRCFDTNQLKQAAGVALEARRLDVLERVVAQSSSPEEMLNYLFSVVTDIVGHRGWRNTVLHVLAEKFASLEPPSHFSACQCYTFLDEAGPVADIISGLLSSGQGALALQLAFILYDNATQKFLDAVSPLIVDQPSGMAVDGAEQVAEPSEAYKTITKVLEGSVALPLYVQFLSRSNHADSLILTRTKDDTVRSVICAGAVVISHGLMFAGTTNDNFLRDNKEWLGKASNWAKFSVVASLGVVHKGHTSASLNVLAPYLPKEGSNAGSVYERSGGLYALGLIHANHGGSIQQYLLDQLNAVKTETEKHGASLGLGLAAMATGNKAIASELQQVYNSDSAVAGEAAGLATGLVMLGSADSETIEAMLNYAHATDHEKIIRGLACGIALTMYGRREEADTLIDQLLSDKDHILRTAAMHTIALAYAGTNDSKAIRRLLHIGVSDVNDDVRRAAITALGFLLFRTPEQCPSVVSLLCESFNPHVRYGAVMALGIACAGSGLKEAVALIEPMTSDSTPFVRQGAYIALGLIMVQQTNKHPKAESTRKLFVKTIGDKVEDVLTKVGAIYGQGIMEAGGRNVTIMHTRGGHTNMPTVTGLFLFTQFWYWFPMAHTLSLAFTPTTVICVTPDLKVPSLTFTSNTKPSLFAYPPMTELPKVEVKEKVTTATLSFSAKLKAKQKKEQEKKEEEIKKDESKMDVDKPAGEVKVKEVEAEFSVLSNPVRVVPAQLKKLSFEAPGRFVPVFKGDLVGGIVVVSDSTPAEPVEYVDLSAPSADAAPASSSDVEPAPPKPFKFNASIDE